MVILHAKDGFAHVYPNHAIDRLSVRKSDDGEYWDLRIVSGGLTTACEIVPYTGELLTRDIFSSVDEVWDLWERGAE